MSNSLGRIRTKRKTGSERVTSEGTDLGFDLLGFWQRISKNPGKTRAQEFRARSLAGLGMTAATQEQDLGFRMQELLRLANYGDEFCCRAGVPTGILRR
jgi:hypothetical protein